MNEESKKIEKCEATIREERILEFWKENKIFEKSVKQTEGRKEFVFYEGPPTANGKPGIHHLEARAFKDAIPRYKTMRGCHVRRKGGWDTHGLPVELQVEKKLGLDSKKAIEEYGIAKFNQQCKESVWEYLEFWNKFTERIGYWVDQENPYVTYHNDYIESLWNIVKKVNERGLLYKDYKVVPWCPRCGTALSSHELAQGYQDVKDLSVYVKFKIIASPRNDFLGPRVGRAESSAKNGLNQTLENHSAAPLYILAWTTTPWTLPGNVALAVGEDIDYVKIKKENEVLILAEKRLQEIQGEYQVLEKLKGKNLIGLEYEPLYPFLQNVISESEKPKLEKAYKVYPADFVTTEDGTGVVHTAVMYGQDDFELGTKIGLPKHHLVGLDGKFLSGTGFLEGRFTRDEETAVEIIKDLAHRGLLLKKEKYEHSYPYCWRCKTALIYYARDSWYIGMSKLRDELIKENEKINWEPAHIREGRFGEWLREIKDWAISRERYWGTPLPVWECEKCHKREVIGSLEELKEKTKKSGNKYFAIRHAQAEANLKGLISNKIESDNDHLTEEGKKQALDSARKLRKEDITLMISSDFLRTKETAEIILKELDLPQDKLVFDKRLREIFTGSFKGRTWREFWGDKTGEKRYFLDTDGSETQRDVKLRVSNFLYDIDKKYKNENILIVTHEGPRRLIVAGALGLNDEETIRELEASIPPVGFSEFTEFPFVPLPHNKDFELDFHRPYIDETEVVCECGGDLKRVKEVMDVWFDSGAMPFAQDHYPFESKKWVEGAGYPADYISEAIDQTRGWFYTLHAVGILMGRGKAYKNVICLGHLLDAQGKKMSKSLGNIVDPWEMIEKYGADTLRLWMYSVNQPGESKNFDEKTVRLLHQQVFGLLYNILAFYELYRDTSVEKNSQPKSGDVLDKWILARMDELTELVTRSLENYRLLEPVRGVRDFIEDLSTWYLRRSRDRMKEGDKEAKQTLYLVLKNLVKLLAPFAPFTAEDIWQKLKNEKEAESVHLAEWPKAGFKFFRFGDKEVLEKMKTVRKIVTLGLERRQYEKIKVRQPLAKIEIWKDSKLDGEYLDLVKDELNVKEVVEGTNIDENILLWTEITPELKAEGDFRELVRALQDMRKDMGLTPKDSITLYIETEKNGEELVKKFEPELLKTVLVSNLKLEKNDGQEVKAGDLAFKVKILQNK